MKKCLVLILVLSMVLGCLAGCSSEDGSGVTISAMQEAIRNATEDNSLSFNVSNVENGKSFELKYSTGMSGTLGYTKEIKGEANKNSNITWIEYSIPKFDETLYEELTFDQLEKDITKNYKNIPMGTLADELDLMEYAYLMSCITGESYTDFYGLDVILNARESAQKNGEWLYSMTMNGSTMTIRAEYQPE